jgi:histidine kinase
LTSDLALLSRAEEGALVLDIAANELGDIARSAAERLRPQFLDQDVTLAVGPLPPLPVAVDADRLAQVFTNLVGNALAHTPAGGRVWLTGGIGDDRCVIAVHDTGAGIPPDQLENIFDRFHRGEGATSGYGGSGIGLTIARTIVRAHGGELNAESGGPGRGSTFTVQLPVAPR